MLNRLFVMFKMRSFSASPLLSLITHGKVIDWRLVWGLKDVIIVLHKPIKKPIPNFIVMELRNIRRFYLIGKGLRIWRKKYAGNVISQTGLKYLFCLHANQGFYAVSTIRLFMEQSGNSQVTLVAMYSALAKLLAAGYVSRDERGRYSLSAAGKIALFQIEKCVRDARPDR